MRSPNSTPSLTPTKSVRVAQVLAFLALVAALIGALGPAERVRTTYSWPPATLPEGTPDRAWYTPLLLIRHQPETVTARIPCEPPSALPRSPSQVTILATARRPERVEGLAVRSDGRFLKVSVGDEVLDQVALPTRGVGPECAYTLRLGDERWSLEGGPRREAQGGELESMPKLTGLFSSLDLREGPQPAIEVTTVPHATRWVTRQAVAWTFGAFAIAAALLLVAVERAPRRPLAVAAGLARGVRASAHPADLVVFAVLLGWWVLSPAFWDDGWIIERVEMYSSSGGFSVYYNGFGTNLPLDYWLEWGQHVLVDVSRALIFLRLPALLCLAATWVLCRWILAQVLPSDIARRGTVVWAMASAFLVGALAWGMTMRPEPVIALLATAVMACMVQFSRQGTTAPLAAVALLVPVALTAHHSSVVSFAPVLACSPRLLTWARTRPAAASALVTSATAALIILFVVGADLAKRREDALIHSRGGASWRHEVERYDLLADFPSGTPLRRASVALIALVVLAWVLRRRRDDGLRSFPGAVVTLALLLLFATPSKLPWHFGALLGMAAVAVAAETARFRDEADRSRISGAWSYAAVGLTIAAAAWSWWPRTAWNTVDLRTLDWTLGIEAWLPIEELAIFLPLVVVAGVALLSRARGRQRPLAGAARAVGAWTAPVLAVPLIAFTAGVLLADTAKTSSWTLPRQNLEALWGDPRCGLGDDLVTSVKESVRPLAVAKAVNAHVPAWVPPAPAGGLTRFVLAPVAGGFGSSAWFALPGDGRFGIYAAGTPTPTDRLSLEWGRSTGEGVVSLGTDRIDVDFVDDEGAAIVAWRLLAAAELPERRRRADVVRVTLRSDVLLAAAVAVTAPVTYRNQTLAKQLEPDTTRSLINPKLVTYFPCLRQPELRNGAVGVPQHIVASDDFGRIWPLGHLGTSPFNGILDLYRLEHLPLADSRDPPRGVLAYEVVDDIPGAMQVAPTWRTWSS